MCSLFVFTLKSPVNSTRCDSCVLCRWLLSQNLLLYLEWTCSHLIVHVVSYPSFLRHCTCGFTCHSGSCTCCTHCAYGFSVQSLPFWIMCLSCCTHCAYGFSVQSLPFWCPKPAILDHVPVYPAVHIVHVASMSKACHSELYACQSCSPHCACSLNIQSLPFWIMSRSLLQSTLCM